MRLEHKQCAKEKDGLDAVFFFLLFAGLPKGLQPLLLIKLS